LSRGSFGAADTIAVYIHTPLSQRLVHWAHKPRTRAPAPRWLRLRAPADPLSHRKATPEPHVVRSSQESLRPFSISLHDRPNDNRPLAKRVPEIVHPDIWSPAGKQYLVVLPQAIQTSDPAVCAAN